MTAIANEPRPMREQAEAPPAAMPGPHHLQPTQRPLTQRPLTQRPPAQRPPAQRPPAQRPPAPVAGSIEDLGRRLLEETNATRCVAYRRSGTGQLTWQYEVAADESSSTGATLGDQAAAAGRAPVQVTRPVRDAFGQIIGVIQTRESSDLTF